MENQWRYKQTAKCIIWQILLHQNWKLKLEPLHGTRKMEPVPKNTLLICTEDQATKMK
jgi:hypothetical protein